MNIRAFPVIWRGTILVLLAGMMPWLPGCGPAYGRFDYVPIPGELLAAEPDVRVLVSVLGVQARASDADRRPALEVRVLVENDGEEPVRFDPGQVRVVMGDLVALDPPIMPGPEPVSIEPGQRLVRQLAFPFPEGRTPNNVNMNGVNVQVAMEGPEGQSRGSLGFVRDYGPAAARAAYGPRTSVQMGVGAVHRIR